MYVNICSFAHSTCFVNTFMKSCLSLGAYFVNKAEGNGWNQGCGVVWIRRFLGGVGFLTTLGVGVGLFSPTPDVQLDHFLHHTPKLGTPVEMVQFLLKLLLKQSILAVHHDFH